MSVKRSNKWVNPNVAKANQLRELLKSKKREEPEQVREQRQERFSAGASENRFMELRDGRDSLMEYYIQQGKMADPKQKYNLGEAPVLVAECMDMCPEFERHEREYQNGLMKFEMIPGTMQVDHQRAVKRFRRSAAGDPPPLPCDVRPPPVLEKTLDYLLDEILSVHGILDSYAFVRDRFRAIRNDLTLQNYRGVEAVTLHEKIARYHIICSHLLCDEEDISLQQEHEQLRKTLQSLIEYYGEMAVRQIEMPNEAEFQAYYILTHPWSNDLVTRCERDLPERVFLDPQVQMALEFRQMMSHSDTSADGALNHYSRVFDILRKPKVSYLFACCAHIEFTPIRRAALGAMQNSYYRDGQGMMVKELVQLLGFDDEADCQRTLNYYEIAVDNVDGELRALIGKYRNDQGKIVPGHFVQDKRVALSPKKSLGLVQAKITPDNATYVKLIAGKKFKFNPSAPAFQTTPSVDKPQAPRSSFSFSAQKPSIPAQTVNRTSTFPPVAQSAPVFPPTSTAVHPSGGSVFQQQHPKQVHKIPPSSTRAVTQQPFTPVVIQQSFTPAIMQPLVPPTNLSFTPSNHHMSQAPILQQPVSDSLSTIAQHVRQVNGQPSNKRRSSLTQQIEPTVKKSALVINPELPLEILAELLDHITAETLSEVYERSQRYNQLTNGFDHLILSQLLDEWIQDLMVESIVYYTNVYQLRQLYEHVFEDLLTDLVASVCKNTKNEMLMQKLRAERLMQFCVIRWQFVVYYNKIKRERDQVLRASFLSALSASALGQHDHASTQSQLLIHETKKMDIDWNFVNSRIKNVIFSALTQTDNSRIKIVCFFMDSKEDPHQMIPSKWFYTCFDRNYASFQKQGLILESNLAIQILTLDTSLKRQQHNSQSSLSGTNAVVLQLQVCHGSQVQYWSKQRELLRKVSDALPVYANVPLLLLYWPTEQLDHLAFQQQLTDVLDSLNNTRPLQFTYIQVLHINLSPQSFDFETAGNMFLEAVQKLVLRAQVEPKLYTDIVECTWFDARSWSIRAFWNF
ncbi:SAC3/GANP/Nin1/mts3/eIF-3 p25 family-domain-containing protein [Gorgonomyces haynaldii]|nr:SAC3/GANP/Nin1/mts3/eIF-3 p25 family-domain-containing protein [Gorgonomyces haynaldii]